jgi:hypothetical protein
MTIAMSLLRSRWSSVTIGSTRGCVLLLEELEELEPRGLPIGAAMVPGAAEGWLPMELLRLLALLEVEPEVPGWLADFCGASVASDLTNPSGSGEVTGGAVGLRMAWALASLLIAASRISSFTLAKFIDDADGPLESGAGSSSSGSLSSESPLWVSPCTYCAWRSTGGVTLLLYSPTNRARSATGTTDASSALIALLSRV